MTSFRLLDGYAAGKCIGRKLKIPLQAILIVILYNYFKIINPSDYVIDFLGAVAVVLVVWDGIEKLMVWRRYG